MNSFMTAAAKPQKISARRRIRVTIGIAGLGAVAGGLTGGIAAAVVSAILDGNVKLLLDWFPYVIGAEIGVPLGAVLLPIAAWTLMRHVPFGRAVVGTIVGTLVGGIAGYFISPDMQALLRSIAGSVIGFTLAAILLRLHARAGSEADASVV